MEINQLFENLSDEESELTYQLQNIIKKEIYDSNGNIPFSRYMELALYYPKIGYYSNPLFKFGAKGDFITAPLVSNLFGHMLATQMNEIFSFGVHANVMEIGAGNGKLASDILIAMGDIIDKYYILELSANLKSWQKETIENKVPQYLHKVIWLDALPSNFEGIIFANEVLDAQPCDLISFDNGIAHGVGVTIRDDKFAYDTYKLNEISKEYVLDLNLDYHDYLTEIHLQNKAFINSISHTLKRGALIFIDYGVGEKEYYHPHKVRGSLRGFFRQHVIDDVLMYPGLIDITTSVNWTNIALSGIQSGLELIGYTNQGSFLINCGLVDMLSNLKSTISDSQYLQISNQVNKLISQNEMGDLFKVCGFSKGISQSDWIGFSNFDKSYLL
ncbi:MAG: SAM-dependent methyltransferase [Burkholderiales bacterium]|nr:SAM-dependent methyltransferase [Burkholderiales bacterium]